MEGALDYDVVLMISPSSWYFMNDQAHYPLSRVLQMGKRIWSTLDGETYLDHSRCKWSISVINSPDSASESVIVPSDNWNDPDAACSSRMIQMWNNCGLDFLWSMYLVPKN